MPGRSHAQRSRRLRYVDDPVAKRVDRDADGDWRDAESTAWYFVTDSQFSVSAVLDASKHVWERIEYDAYGKARHRYAGDVDGDGMYGGIFEVLLLGSDAVLGDPGYHADFDVNLDGLMNISASPTDVGILAARGSAVMDVLPDGWISDPSSMDGPDNSIGYAGYVFNPEREDYTVRHRMYAPELGRWRTRDPIGNVDGESLVQYTRSNPIYYTDPSGLRAAGDSCDPSEDGKMAPGRMTPPVITPLRHPGTPDDLKFDYKKIQDHYNMVNFMAECSGKLTRVVPILKVVAVPLDTIAMCSGVSGDVVDFYHNIEKRLGKVKVWIGQETLECQCSTSLFGLGKTSCKWKKVGMAWYKCMRHGAKPEIGKPGDSNRDDLMDAWCPTDLDHRFIQRCIDHLPNF